MIKDKRPEKPGGRLARAKEADATAAPSRKNALGIRFGDFILGGGVLLLAVGLLLGFRLLAGSGSAAVVVSPEGETALSLQKDALYSFTGQNGIRVTIRVEQGRVRFEESACPDKVCVHSGWLSRAGETAACLPARILIRIDGGSEPDENDVDTVVR